MSMADRDGLIWLDGEMVPWREAKTHVLTHTLHYGYGAFEGIRAYRRSSGESHVFRLEEHIRRLFESAHILGIEVPYSRGELIEACIETLKANNYAEGYLRPLIYLGDEAMGLGALGSRS